MSGITKKRLVNQKKAGSENTFPNKDWLYDKFENLRQSLLNYRELADQNASLKNHQDWIVDIFSVLVKADTILNEYEAGINSNSISAITVYDLLGEQADLLEEMAPCLP
ncbi:hypothetical protein [Methylomonas koyamae]|uniref:hypothetical protein n=1 Tax=Methylomonas koyamae TaxID=702114 RepID=UPI000ABC1EF2|nr:hypothetical protein [Methylomonas koyamae]